MQKTILTIVSLIFVGSIFGQYATFTADSTHLWEHAGQRQDLYNEMMLWEWRIQDQTTHFGGKPIKIKPHEGIDTLFFRKDENYRWDTMLCRIHTATAYEFIYNACCGSFNVKGRKHPVTAKVLVNIKGNKDMQYLCTLGENGMLIPGPYDTLKTACRSAMASNIIPISFSCVTLCDEYDEENCPNGTCLVSDYTEDDYGTAYNVISKKLEVLYMPLDNKPLLISYDAVSDKISIE